ncbi:uncharacterized protein BKA78DRAFT_304559 [Phyllosticta capitalensis]|uniref:uncharacterized protein n=1 Tax=Phyllosticta capitalensis TaxID=121624 RepID=UPI0031326572
MPDWTATLPILAILSRLFTSTKRIPACIVVAFPPLIVLPLHLRNAQCTGSHYLHRGAYYGTWHAPYSLEYCQIFHHPLSPVQVHSVGD